MLKAFLNLCLLASLVIFLLYSVDARADKPTHSTYVFPGKDGRLVYKPYTDQGDILPDFSHCGYMGGGVALPDVPTKITLEPTPDQADDRGRIQHAIDQVSKMPPDEHGFRGAVLLKRGTYHVAGTLSIHTSGVVLRGEGDGKDGTILIASRHTKYTLIWVAGSGGREIDEASRVTITDAYKPVGSRSFTVEKPNAFEVGDTVLVCRHGNADWIKYIGMVPIGWRPFTLQFRRVVTSVEGNTVTVDAPIVNAMQQEFGGGSIVKYQVPGHIQNCGVENLRAVSVYKHATDHAHAWRAIRIDKASNCWFRNIIAQHFAYSCVQIGGDAKWITVKNCQCIDMISRIKGGLRYPFAVSGQLCLIYRCFASHGRHDFVMHAWVPGPNAFVDCRSRHTYSDSGPHHRYATGTLYDNVETARLNSQNRGHSGSGHGWAGAQTLMWNCTAGSIDVQQPPTAQSFAIGGTVGRAGSSGLLDKINQRVTPRSLYFAQLRDRLGLQSVAAVQQWHQPLVASNQSWRCPEGGQVVLELEMIDSDQFAGPPRVDIIEPPAHGTLHQLSHNTFRYESHRGDPGPDTFTWRAVEKARYGTYVKLPDNLEPDTIQFSEPATATIHLVADQSPPLLLEAFALPNRSEVFANFSEPVRVSSDGQTSSTYQLVTDSKTTGLNAKQGATPEQVVLEVENATISPSGLIQAKDVSDQSVKANIGGGEARIVSLIPGVAYQWVNGAARDFIDFDMAPTDETGVSEAMKLINPAGREGFSLLLEGWLLIEQAGVYHFATESDDGSQLELNQRTVVDNGGLHPLHRVENTVTLRPGLHAIRVQYFDGGGDAVLNVQWRPPGQQDWSAIPADRLYCLPR